MLWTHLLLKSNDPSVSWQHLDEHFDRLHDEDANSNINQQNLLQQSTGDSFFCCVPPSF